jgi:uncharacterized metal-binding protein YceD (DUF177 family)
MKKELPIYPLRSLAKNRTHLKVSAPLVAFERLVDTLRAFLVGGESEDAVFIEFNQQLQHAFVSIDLYFGQTRTGSPALQGTVDFKVPFSCFDCEVVYQQSFHLPICLLVAFSDSEAGLMAAEKKHYISIGAVDAQNKADRFERFDVVEEFDVICVPADEVTLAELIEDDLILALPLVARHEGGHCQEGSFFEDEADKIEVNELENDVPTASKKENPFKVLGKLLQN